MLTERRIRWMCYSLVLALIILVNLYLYVSPHFCMGLTSTCSQYTMPNGTVRAVLSGKVGTITDDPRGPLLFDLVTFLGVCGYLAYAIQNRARRDGLRAPDGQARRTT